MRLHSLLLSLARVRPRPSFEVVETAGGGPKLVGDEPPVTLEARRLLLNEDVAADFAIGIAPAVHPLVLAEMGRLHDEAEAEKVA